MACGKLPGLTALEDAEKALQGKLSELTAGGKDAIDGIIAEAEALKESALSAIPELPELPNPIADIQAAVAEGTSAALGALGEAESLAKSLLAGGTPDLCSLVPGLSGEPPAASISNKPAEAVKSLESTVKGVKEFTSTGLEGANPKKSEEDNLREMSLSELLAEKGKRAREENPDIDFSRFETDEELGAALFNAGV